MRRTDDFRMVLVTAPDLKTGRHLAKTALTQRLVACVNLVPRIESHYWWKDKLESGAEVLMVLKTTARNLRKLEQLILEHHPYETPEFISFRLQGGNRRYLRWLENSVNGWETE